MSPGVESVGSNRLCMGKVTTSFTGQSENLHILAGICPLENLYLEGKTPYRLGTGWLTLGISCRKQAKAMHAGIWVRIPT